MKNFLKEKKKIII